jgi:adenylosuccinate synthase
MDQGMTIHVPDLRTEVEGLETNPHVGDLRGKLILSPDAVLCTDLERAEELLNRRKSNNADGGTGRGIGPSYAHHYDKTGLHIHDLMEDNWREVLGQRYERYRREFALFAEQEPLERVLVPDLAETNRTGHASLKPVGTQKEFLDGLESARTWLIDRNMVQNTFPLHRDIKRDLSQGVLFEVAQAMGLHAWLGTKPDMTASDTSPHGVVAGTALWRPTDIKDKVGVFKITYQSSVGSRHMPTEVPLAKTVRTPQDLDPDATDEQRWAADVRDTAHEFGATTRRPRDICRLDLPLLQYNAMMAEIDMLAGTHLDIAREGVDIQVCTHYTDHQGNFVPYQPGLRYLAGVVPHYVTLPGWDGETCRKASSFDTLPENAKKFLAFIQELTQIPIIAATTGPEREHYLALKNS